VISNPLLLKAKMNKMMVDGIDNLRIFSDFDKTMCLRNYRGKRYNTTMTVLFDSEHSSFLLKKNMSIVNDVI